MCNTIFWNCAIKYSYSFLVLYVRVYWEKTYNMCNRISSFANYSSTYSHIVMFIILQAIKYRSVSLVRQGQNHARLLLQKSIRCKFCFPLIPLLLNSQVFIFWSDAQNSGLSITRGYRGWGVFNEKKKWLLLYCNCTH